MRAHQRVSTAARATSDSAYTEAGSPLRSIEAAGHSRGHRHQSLENIIQRLFNSTQPNARIQSRTVQTQPSSGLT
jgi:hypothetical protein